MLFFIYISNSITIPKSSNLSNENILHHYLDSDTVPAEDYLDENGWVTGDRSDILIEEAMQKAQVDAGRRYNGEHNKSVTIPICFLPLIVIQLSCFSRFLQMKLKSTSIQI